MSELERLEGPLMKQLGGVIDVSTCTKAPRPAEAHRRHHAGALRADGQLRPGEARAGRAATGDAKSEKNRYGPPFALEF